MANFMKMLVVLVTVITCCAALECNQYIEESFSDEDTFREPHEIKGCKCNEMAKKLNCEQKSERHKVQYAGYEAQWVDISSRCHCPPTANSLIKITPNIDGDEAPVTTPEQRTTTTTTIDSRSSTWCNRKDLEIVVTDTDDTRKLKVVNHCLCTPLANQLQCKQKSKYVWTEYEDGTFALLRKHTGCKCNNSVSVTLMTIVPVIN
jgi:uncharacterized protein (DUF2249 family)